MRTIIAALLCVLAISTAAEARGRGGLRCGAVQAAHFGYGSRLALDWARDFQHVSAPQIGAVVVQRRNGRDSAGHPGGHVSRIVQTIDQCTAIVADEKGTYRRDICKNLVAIVVPSRQEHHLTAVSPLVKATSRRLSPQAVAYASVPDRHAIR